jgi:hypothetical protein
VHKHTAPELFADRDDRTVIIAPDESVYQISCFTQTVAASDASDAAAVQTALVMKVCSAGDSPAVLRSYSQCCGILSSVQCLGPHF